MSVFSTGPGGGIFAKALTDVLGIGASINGQGGLVSRLGPAIRRVIANPNGVVSDFGGSLAMDPQGGTLYINKGVGNATSTTWVDIGVTAGGQAVFGQFSHSTTENLVAGTTYVQDYTTTEDSNGVSITNDGLGKPTRLTVAADGVYAFTLSPQLLKGGGGQTNIAFWPSLMGTAIPRSGSIIDLPNNVQTLPFIEIIVRMTAGQYVQWNFRTPGNGVSLINIPAAAPVPDAPSVIAGVKRIGS